MLSQISIDNQDEDARVEELSKEDSLSNQSLLRWNCGLAYPFNQLDDNQFEGHIHTNDDERDRLAHDETPQGIAEVSLANGAFI